MLPALLSAEQTGGDVMDVNARLTRLEAALIDLVIIVTQGRWGRLSTHMEPEVVEAGRRQQAFHRAVVNEREF